jgi:folate-binding protein YgfZ
VAAPSTDMQAAHAAVRAAGGYGPVHPPRTLIEVTGGDRQSWLHNLTTNVVTSLNPGEGNYFFAINVQGRVIFDGNVLVFADRLWLELDARWEKAALAHLNKYVVVEDVALCDITAEWTGYEIFGPRAADCMEGLGLGNNFTALADVQHLAGAVAGANVHLVKDHLGPIPRGVLWVASDAAPEFAARLAEVAADCGLIAADATLRDTIRMEAGFPQSVDDIDDQVIPPETHQVERGISYVKGCYLGQEVIERMRSRGSMARGLVGLSIPGERVPEHGAPVFANGKEVGRVTSACHSPVLGTVLALGYVKTLLVESGQPLQVATSADTVEDARLVTLPLAAWSGAEGA